MSFLEFAICNFWMPDGCGRDGVIAPHSILQTPSLTQSLNLLLNLTTLRNARKLYVNVKA